jgi:2,5-diketo-D-gluconate reductase B
MNIPKINGIPAYGLGTWPMRGTELTSAIAVALELGVRHIDTAQMYGNERDVGKAIAASGLLRAEIFITTKVDPGNLSAQRFASSVARSIDDLGGPADLLLIHWPPPDREIDAAVDRLVAEKERGNARLIGVSNFTPRMLGQAQARAKGQIINNQVEFHPLLDQTKLLATAKELGVALSAYSPLARGKAMEPRAVQDIAKRLGKPASAVVLRWILQQGVIAVPKTATRENAEANIAALSFELTDQDMAILSRLGTPEGRMISMSSMTGRWDD